MLTKNTKQWIEALGYEIPNDFEQMQDLGEKFKPYLHMLGNQALFNDKANRGAKDLPFAKKKDFYKRQALELTKSLAHCEKWSLSQISARQKELANTAHLTWRK